MAPSAPEEDLAHAPLEPVAYLANASNATVLVRLGSGGGDGGGGAYAVYKPREGERPLWDFPVGTLCLREVAAYRVSEHLGWGLVPETLLRDGPAGPGSVQRFVPHDPRRHYFALVEDPAFHPPLARMALYDLLINNADRKASHVLLAEDGRLLGCDHGLAFHTEPKLRTVIWDLGGTRVEEPWRRDLERLAATVGEAGLGGLLSDAECDALRRRAERLAAIQCLPDLPPDRRPYPWPLV